MVADEPYSNDSSQSRVAETKSWMVNMIEKQKMVYGESSVFAAERKDELGEPMINKLQSIRDKSS